MDQGGNWEQVFGGSLTGNLLRSATHVRMPSGNRGPGIGSVQQFIERGARGYHGIYWWVPDLLAKGDHGEFAAVMDLSDIQVADFAGSPADFRSVVRVLARGAEYSGLCSGGSFAPCMNLPDYAMRA